MTSFNLYEAYAAVYDEDLREDILAVEEDFSFIDDLSDNELDEIMEEILSEGEVTLTESVEIFEELIMELNPYAPAGSKEAKAYAKSTTKSKRSAEASERRAARVERIKSAAKRAGEAVKSTSSKVASAASAGASEAGRRAKAGADYAGRKATAGATAVGKLAKAGAAKVGGKLAAAKERIKGFIKSGRKAVAGGLRGLASKVEPKEATGKEVKAAAKSAVSSERKPAPYRMVGKSGGTRVASGSEERKALPPVGKTKSGKDLTLQQRGMQTAAQNARLERRLGEDLELLASYILEDLISEGYAETFEEAFEVLESFSDYEVGELAENYLVEETVDLYDVVLEHLLDEGFADTEEAATVIMANMSEEWRDDILETKMDPRGRPASGPMNVYANPKRKPDQAHLDAVKAYDEKQKKKTPEQKKAELDAYIARQRNK